MPTKKPPKPPKIGTPKWSAIPESTLEWDCQTREACQVCTLCPTTPSPNPWMGVLSCAPGKVLTLGLSPAWLSGSGGTLFWRAVRETGLSPDDLVISSVLRCNPKGAPSMKQLRCCRPGLLTLIAQVQPRAILGCGHDVYKSLVNAGDVEGIISVRGRPFEVEGVKTYMTYAPASINAMVHGQSQGFLYDYLVRDLERVRNGMPIEFPDNEVPGPGYLGTKLVLAVDAEYTPDTLLNLAFANTTQAMAVTLPDYVPSLSDIDIICGHNVSCEVDQLVKFGMCKEGWATGEQTIDSMYLAWHVNENRGPGGFKLENVLAHDVTVEGWKDKTEGPDPLAWDPQERAERCRKDAWASAVIIQHNTQHAHGRLVVTHRLAQSIHRLSHAGAYIDSEALFRMDIDLTMSMNYNKEMFHKVNPAYTKEIDLTNDNHIRDFLFNHRKLKPLGQTSAGLPSIDVKYVEYYQESEPDLVYLLEYMKAHKIWSTYVNPLDEKLDKNGWLPVDLGMLTRTGRRHGFWHTWPESVKPLVRSRYPDGQLVSFDYAKLEIIIMAVLAKEWKLYEYFTKGSGYIGVGEHLLGTTVKKDTREYRLTKSTVLGIHYGITPWGLATKLWYEDKIRLSDDYTEHQEATKDLVQKYFGLFPRLGVYQRSQKSKLLANQSVDLPDGRIRHLPLPLGQDTKGFHHIVNEAMNSPVQGTASFLVGTALVDTEDALRQSMGLTAVEYHRMLMEKEWPDAVLWLERHDELGVDSRLGCYADVVYQAMTELKTFRYYCPMFKHIEFGVEAKQGTHWQ